jgi:hypothetical protein
MMILARLRALLPFSVAAFVFTACGGGGGSNGSASPPPIPNNWDQMSWDQGKWQ